MDTKPPTALDHLVLGCEDLHRGMAFVEQHLGVRPQVGGVHRGRGTRNAILSLGPDCYLEIIAPDPQQERIEPWTLQDLPSIRTLATPRFIGYAVSRPDIGSFVARRRAGMEVRGPWEQSREESDGRLAKWKMATLPDDRHGILPFFIEWGPGSIHPSEEAPQGCRLARFTLAAPDVENTREQLRVLEIEADVIFGERPELLVRIEGPRGAISSMPS